LGTHFAAWLHPDDAERFTAALNGAARHGGTFTVGEIRVQHADGLWRILEVKANDRLADPTISGIILNSRNITERKRVEEALQHQAMHDDLTGMPNRALYDDRIDQALRAARRDQTSLAVCWLDLDRFKEVNDAFGHRYGDLLLKAVTARLRSAVRASDTVARLGGDEFAIILPDAGERTAVDIAMRIHKALAKPLEIEGHSPQVAASIGIALYPLHGEDATTLAAHADVAMYEAKRGGGGYAIYDVVQDEHSPDHLTLPQEFRHALNTGGLHLHYQPLVDLATKRVTTVEALLRWQHPRHGFIPPARFLPLAERIGAIIPLTRWVLDTAVQQCAEWRRKGLMLPVAVNISTRVLQSPELPSIVLAVLRKYGVPGPCLTLEIVENALMTEPERMLDILTALSAEGVHIAIDDFGTGFSSVAFLKQLPVDEIKIDRSFVSSMVPGKRDEAIVHSIIDLSHSLGLSVVAEGIEDETTLGRLAELGCDVGQGFHMSRPVPAAELERWVVTTPWHAERESTPT
jgi:diguanylate cyclase (GGDEF)-like protein